jgi:hypothetical protein
MLAADTWGDAWRVTQRRGTELVETFAIDIT